jgi:hypothetical protein
MSPGRSFQSNSMHVHDLVPYLRSGNHHDFGHVINRFSFGADGDPLQPTKEMLAVKKRLDIIDPLQGVKGHTEESNYMFQCVLAGQSLIAAACSRLTQRPSSRRYFIKVVSTQFVSLSGAITPSHQVCLEVRLTSPGEN